jgi:low affinity Fe/Cu permease
MTSHPVRRWLTEIGVFTAHPAAFVVLVVYAAAWLVFQRETFDWHALATLATWFMTLVIQRAEHRDTQALHAKLDELLRVHGDARNDLMKLDQKDPEDIEQHRNQAQKQN